ncbi:uncharacterized protein LOC133294798 [Gastrolobium bilobum]|uniref:uncharacterized protein LOC133294798 n=1 Tax=Gastrolobium bilobum TaxID=150636 RepID=UPI002AB28CB0|nr:uncharacterized protein LOC133294798 [Gastrolobium bilobum]
MANEKDWDLSAIFRCCRTANFTATTKTPPITTTTATQDTNFCMADHLILRQEEDDSFSFPVPEPLPTNGFDEHPLLMNFKPTTITNTNTSGNNIKSYSTFGEQWMQQGYHPVPAPTNYTSIGASTNYQPQWHAQQPQPQPSQQQHQHNQVPQISPVILQNIRPPTPISRKRKIDQVEMLCHMNTDNLEADLWASRRYEKCIKYSAYLSSRECEANMIAEESTTELNMLMGISMGDDDNNPKPFSLPYYSTYETGSTSNAANMDPRNSEFCPVQFSQALTENIDFQVGGGEPEGKERPTELDDDILIPNIGTMAEIVFVRDT